MFRKSKIYLTINWIRMEDFLAGFRIAAAVSNMMKKVGKTMNWPTNHARLFQNPQLINIQRIQLKIHEIAESDNKDDDIVNCNSALITDDLFFMNFLNAIAEGDGGRIMRQYKYLMLYCMADTHSITYIRPFLCKLFCHLVIAKGFVGTELWTILME